MYKNKGERDAIRASLVIRTAETCGVSPRFVRLVLNGERENENVMATYYTLKEGENKLLQEVKNLVPFTF